MCFIVLSYCQQCIIDLCLDIDKTFIAIFSCLLPGAQPGFSVGGGGAGRWGGGGGGVGGGGGGGGALGGGGGGGTKNNYKYVTGKSIYNDFCHAVSGTVMLGTPKPRRRPSH